MINWEHNEWQGDARWDDKEHAKIEALRKIAEELDRLNQHLESIETAKIWDTSQSP